MKTIVIDLTSENSQDCNWSTADESQNTTFPNATLNTTAAPESASRDLPIKIGNMHFGGAVHAAPGSGAPLLPGSGAPLLPNQPVMMAPVMMAPVSQVSSIAPVGKQPPKAKPNLPKDDNDTEDVEKLAAKLGLQGLQNQPNTSTSNQNQVNRESRDTRNPTNPNPTNLKPQTNNRNKDEDVIDQQTS